MQIFDLYKKSLSGLSKEVWLLSLITLINRSGTMVIPFMMVYLTYELGFSLPAAGLVMTCFGAGSFVGSWLGGWLTDRIGHYKVQFWSLFLGGAMFMLLLFMKTLVSICVTIFILSTIADAFRPALMSSIAIYSKPENQTRSLSLIRLAINLGFAVGPAIGGLLAGSVGYDWLFILDGLTCMSAGILFWVLIENKTPVAKEEEDVEKEVSQSAYKDVLFLSFMAFVFLNAMVFMQLFYTVPVFYKKEFLLTEFQIGVLMAFNGGLIFILEMPLVYVLERRYNKMSLISIGVFMVGLSYLIFNIPGPALVIAYLAMIMISIGEIICFPFSNAFVLGRSNEENRGQYMGTYAMTFSAAMIVSPGLGAYLADNVGFHTLWMMMMGISLVSTFGFLWLRPKIAVDLVGQDDLKVSKDAHHEIHVS